MKKKLFSTLMSIALAVISMPLMKQQTAKAWWWDYKDVIIWEKSVDGSTASSWGPQLTYHIVFMDTDYDEYWIGDHIAYNLLSPYFNPQTAQVLDVVNVEKSLLNSSYFVHCS